MRDPRLGDIIDDWCVKCRRLTNHAIVSLMEAEAAKVRCRSCYSDHNYLKEIAPPSKKELKKLADAALAANGDGPEAVNGDTPEIVPEAAGPFGAATRKSSA